MKAKVLNRRVARRVLTDYMAVDLDSYTAIDDDAAGILSKCIFGLELRELTELSDEAAKELGRRKGGDLDLSGLHSLSVVAAKALAGTEGILMLRGLKEISDEVAVALSEHDGPLILSGLTSLSGAPGIGLARLLTLDVLDTPEVRQDVENAVAFSLELAKKPNPGESDHVCCGIAGRADFLLEAAGRLRRPEWEDAARASASFILRRFRSKDRYTFNGERSGPVFSPGLFTGLSGVGRLFLRVACRGNFS